MSWEPILEGELADRAWVVVRDIADGLAGLDSPTPDLTLFWTYAAASLDDALATERGDAAIARFAAGLAHREGRVGLHGGIAGSAWVAAHIADDLDELLDAVDRTLIEQISNPAVDYDLISGLVGFAIYFLERGDAPAASTGLGLIVDQLASTCVRTADGATWHTPRERIPPGQVARFPDGYYNCGLAHGVPGVVVALAKIAARPDAPNAVATLRDTAVRWLLAQRLDERGFPAMAGEGPARTAWCYGDPGVSIALWHADLSRSELDPIIRGWTERIDTGVRDAAICHGAAGLAHICNRLFHASRDPYYRDVARAWFERTLAFHRPGEGIGGFTMAPNLIDGTAGVGLALLAALAPIEPGWDRLFLCDLPVRST